MRSQAGVDEELLHRGDHRGSLLRFGRREHLDLGAWGTPVPVS